MRAFLIRPIRFYFGLFLLLGLITLVGFNFNLYQQGLYIKSQVEQESNAAAKEEMQQIFTLSFSHLQQEIQDIASWDEVYQQFADPSYYFFWHGERLQESGYYRSYYNNLELYYEDGRLLMPGSLQSNGLGVLPKTIKNKQAMLVKQPVSATDSQTNLNLFQPIFKRNSPEILGYVGLSINLKQYLINTNHYYNVDEKTLNFTFKTPTPYDQIMQVAHFKPTKNPINNRLWQLIQNFIISLMAIMLLLGLLIALLFHFAVNRPISIISDFLNAIKQSPNQLHAKPKEWFFLTELDELKDTLFHYHKELLQAHDYLDKQNQTFYEQARRDALTNAFNRRAFDEAWLETRQNFTHKPFNVAFMLIDCDFFKALNDSYGHELGDQVITLTAQTLQKHLPINCPPYRIGGDEFAVIITHYSSNKTDQIAQDALAALQHAPFKKLGIKEAVNFSIGMSSTLQDDIQEIDHLPRQADIAMYRAKQAHKDKIQCYHRQRDKDSLALVSNTIITAIINAVHTGEGMEMHFQPIKNLKTNTFYFESLLRLRHENQLIFPNDIFNVVERRRLEIELDQQVIKQIENLLRQHTLPPQTGVAINISGKTLLQPDFVDLFTPIKPFLQDYKIVIELTENILVDHMDYATKVLNELRDSGFKIALDDFGSGYSSIRYLAKMPVDIVKFDLTLTHSLINGDHKTQNILRTTAQMILNAGYDLVMEGVEDAKMLQLVTQLGATHAQGYFLGKPSPNAHDFLPKHK